MFISNIPYPMPQHMQYIRILNCKAFSIHVGSSDFEDVQSIQCSNNSVQISLFASIDDISLEIGDRINLMFRPEDPSVVQDIENNGEFIRDTATVNIIDINRKYNYVSVNL